MESKNFLLSKTFIGAVIMIAAPLLSKFGIVLATEGMADEILSLVGFALSVYGRFTAKKELTVLPKA